MPKYRFDGTRSKVDVCQSVQFIQDDVDIVGSDAVWKCCDALPFVSAGDGVAAVDTRVIPLGTKLYVEGYGYCIAADTGGAIKGNRIDLCYGTHSAALSSGFGHKNVKVYIIG